MNGLYTDVIFKGFYQTHAPVPLENPNSALGQSNSAQSNLLYHDGNNSQLSQHSYSDEDMKDGNSGHGSGQE
jgi:hypothetical protein